MAVYLSYFNNPNVKRSNRKKYSIARHQFIDMPKAGELLVPRILFENHKKGLVSFEDLCAIYYLEVLEKLDAKSIADKYDGAILCCHEKERCHRIMIKYWLENKGLEVEEYKRNT